MRRFVIAVIRFFPTSSLCGYMMLAAGCQVHNPDVAADVQKATGLSNAIVFRDAPAPLEGPELTGNLSPDQAVRLAVMNDPRIQSALADVRASEADALQTRLLPNPVINLDIRFPTMRGQNQAVEASLAEDIIALLQKPNQMAASDKRLRAGASNALTVVLDVISEVQIAYTTARSTEATIANAQRRLDILEHLRGIAQNRVSVGDAGQLDVLTLDAQILQGQLDLSDLSVTLDEQRFLLAKLIGQPRARADWKLSDLPVSSAELAPESDWINTALKNRPEVVAKGWQLRALGNDYDATILSPFVGSQIGVHAEHDPHWRVGPTLSIPLPIFDFGQAVRDKLSAQEIGALDDLATEQLQVIEETRVAYMTYIRSRQTLETASNKLIPLQRRQLDQTRRAYQGGDVDLATLLLAETDMELALAKVVDLEQKVTVARIKLERAAGGSAIAAGLRGAETMPAVSEAAMPESRPTTMGDMP